MKLPGKAIAQFLYFVILIVALLNASTVKAQVTSDQTSDQFSFSGFPSNALVLLADGSEKHIEDIQAGDVIAAYDPLAEGFITTRVERVQKCGTQARPMVSVMLVLEDFSVSLQANKGLAGVILQATADQKVLTNNGLKAMGQVQEGDKLYCYDEASGLFLAFNVYAIQTTTSVAEIYGLETESNTCLINNTVVINHK